MYKTIRHGENSLQYTILPQNDDFRIEGKLSSAGSSCSSASGRKSKAKRPRRRSFFAYLGLIFVCTVIVGALLIPFLVSAERFPSPTEWFTKTRAALIKSNVRAGGDGAGGGGGGVSGNGVNVGKIIKIINKDGAARAVWGGNQTGVGGNPPAPGGNPPAPGNGNATKPNTQAYPSTNSTSNSRKDSAETEAVTTIVAAERNVNGNAPAESKVDQQPEMPADGIQIESHLVGADGGEDDQPLEPTPQTQGHFVTEVRFESPKSNDGDDSHLSAIVPTIVVTTLRISDPSSSLTAKTQTSPPPMVRPTSSLSSSNVNAPHLPVGNNGGFGAQPAPPAMPTIMTRIIQVPLLKSASKKPIIPPVLAKTNSQFVSGPGQDDVVGPAPAVDNSHQSSAAGGSVLTQNANIKTANANWINSHWPYIDPSTYFQWTGYKAEDSVLLPALLGFALIGMILIITVCLVARNKRTIVSSVRKRNRNDIEETGAEDNATLLTTTNLSDED